jgi:hypothetical protein
MKILSVLSARATWLFDLNVINPTGLAYQPLLAGIKERYCFAKAPVSMLERDEKKSLHFDQGEFMTPDGRNIFISFRIYNDGIVATTSSSTNDATSFLVDLGLYVQSSGFSMPSHTELGKSFVSVLQVECEVTLQAVNPQLERITRFIESRIVTMDGKPRQFQLGALNFWSEDITKNFAPSAFKFERKHGSPFTENKYYSEAPLQTQEHIELLEELEKMLGV